MDVLKVNIQIGSSPRLLACQGMDTALLGTPGRASLGLSVWQEHSLSASVLQEHMQRALKIVEKRQDNISTLRYEGEKVCLKPPRMKAQLAYATIYTCHQS